MAIKVNVKTAQLAQRLVEQLLSIPLLEMGSIRNEYRVKIECMSKTLLLHILCLQFDKSSRHSKHWKQEVESYCKSISYYSRLPQTPFTPSEIHKMLVTGVSVEMAVDDYGSKLSKKIAITEATKSLNAIVPKLCVAMAAKNSLSNIKSTIEKLWPS